MREEQSYERLLQALQDMKSEIAKQIRPVEEQIIQANVEHLRQTFNQESRRLSKCLEEIDDNILACRQYLQDYERIRSSLYGLNEKLTQLGASPFRFRMACRPPTWAELSASELISCGRKGKSNRSSRPGRALKENSPSNSLRPSRGTCFVRSAALSTRDEPDRSACSAEQSEAFLRCRREILLSVEVLWYKSAPGCIATTMLAYVLVRRGGYSVKEVAE